MVYLSKIDIEINKQWRPETGNGFALQCN